jgi:UDP-glucuronate decarboxylase
MALDDGRVVSNFIVQALRNEPITIYGDGLQTRSFCYVGDLIRGLVSLFFHSDQEHGPINLGNPDEFTMLDLAKFVIEATNSNSKLIFMDLPSDDPRQRKPDISKASQHLNWIPEVKLKDGLTLTVEEFQRRI